MSSDSDDTLEKLLSIRASTEVAGAASGSDDLRQLLKELHPPKGLPGLYQVVRHTITLFGFALTSTGTDEHERRMIRTYLVELLWLRQNLRQISKKLFDDRKKREQMLRRWGKNPVLWKRATEHGLWCLLWHDHPDPLLASVFRLLQSDALAAQRGVVRYRSDRDDWEQGKKHYHTLLRSLYEETSEIRKFVLAKYRSEYDPILHQLAAQKVSPQNLASAIRDIAAKLAPKEEEAPTPFFSSLGSMLWLFRRKQHPDSVRSVKRVNVKEILGPNAKVEPPAKKPGDEEPTSTPMDDESEQSDDLNAEDDKTESERAAADFEKVIVEQWTPEQLKTCRDLGLHPSEVLPPNHAYLSRRKSGPLGRASWRARENQLLRWALDRPPLELVADALGLCTSRQRRTTRWGLRPLLWRWRFFELVSQWLKRRESSSARPAQKMKT